MATIQSRAPDLYAAVSIVAGIPARNGIGDYVPYFAHSPLGANGVRKIYPQVADDLSTVLALVEEVIGHLE